MKYAQFSDNEVREILSSKNTRQTFLEILARKIQERLKIVRAQKRKLKEYE